MPTHETPLVETRQTGSDRRKEAAHFRPTVGPPRGVLQQPSEKRGERFFHQRLAPPVDLHDSVQHFWFVTWDLRGMEPATAETLPHPNCYLVIENSIGEQPDGPAACEKAEISGVATGKFSRVMEGWGQVFGLKFTPGGLRAFYKRSVSELTDRVVPAQDVFGAEILDLASTISALRDPVQMAAHATDFLRTTAVRAHDPNIALSTQLVGLILSDATILTVESLASRSGYSARSLQRLFREYVGATPKWVIRRYRLHELLERLHSDTQPNIAHLAAELGYADQAHLSHDFRRLSGYTPQEYRRRVLLVANAEGK